MICVGRYELRQIIGRGGMAEVWDAYDVRLDRSVAVKVLRSDFAEQLEVRTRFEAEAHAAARISHPNVVVLYDTGVDGGAPYLVMERLPGRTLADDIAAAPLAQNRAVLVACEVLAGLAAAHAVGVVHRDIKPSNVLFTVEGNAKVADFGIAKVAELADATRTGLLLGTPSYVAPERIAGGPASVVSDVYAVGVLLYEALTRHKPFTADTPIGLLRAIAAGNATPVEALRPDIDRRLAAVINTAMAVDPSHRFASATAMAAALSPFLADHRPPLAPTVVMAEPTVLDLGVGFNGAETIRPVRPGRRIVMTRVLGAGVACLILATFAVVALRTPSRRHPPAATTTTTSSSSTIPPALAQALNHLDKTVRP